MLAFGYWQNCQFPIKKKLQGLIERLNRVINQVSKQEKDIQPANVATQGVTS